MRLLKETKNKAFTLLELMTVVVIITILAATAIPLVSRYLKKSKTTEAALNLRKVYDGEVSYFQEERVDTDGKVIDKQFVSAAATPSSPGRDKQTGNFEVSSWLSIKFSPDGPVLYSYSVTASGTGFDASFTARAEGDIDGDSATSLFERVGTIDPSGEIKGGAALFALDEWE